MAWVWIHRESENDPSTQGIYFILTGETFNITKNVFQVAIPDEDASNATDLGQGSYVMSLGGSRKSLRISGRYKGSDFMDAVNFYNKAKGYINSIGIEEKVIVDVFSVEPTATNVPLYSYDGVISSSVLSLLQGAPAIVSIDLTIYVGQVL